MTIVSATAYLSAPAIEQGRWWRWRSDEAGACAWRWRKG